MKYDWEKLKRKFIVGNSKSVRDFAKKEGITYNAYFAIKTKGWADEKKSKTKQKESKITEATLAHQAETEIDRNKQVLLIVDNFLIAISDITSDLVKKKQFKKMSQAKNISALAKSLESLQKIHRIGDGLDVGNSGNNGNELAEAIIKAAERGS